MLTMTYTRPSGEEVSITIKGQAFGSDDTPSRRQVVGRTLGEAVYVYDLSVNQLEMNLQIDKMSADERADLEWFFSEDNVNLCRRWFKISLPPVRKKVLVCDAEVEGVGIMCDQGLACDEFLLQDELTYTVRLMNPALPFVEPPCEGYYSTTLPLKVLLGFLPDNAC